MSGASTGLTLQYEKRGRGQATEPVTPALGTQVCASGSELGQGRAGAAAPTSSSSDAAAASLCPKLCCRSLPGCSGSIVFQAVWARDL